MNQLEHLTTIQAKPEEVFALLSNPSLLDRQTQGIFEVVDVKAHLPLAKGDEVHLHFRWNALHINCAFVIDEFLPGQKFAYHQSAGLISVWRHSMDLREVDGGTELRDRINYDLGLGIIGALADDLFFRRQLKDYLQIRSENIRQLI